MSGRFCATLPLSVAFVSAEPSLISDTECANYFLANPNMWLPKCHIFNCSMDHTPFLCVS